MTREAILNQLIDELTKDKDFKIDIDQLSTDGRFEIITTLINRSHWSEIKKSDTITAIMLLQLSFDMHQTISSEVENDNSWTILQGDRLSSQYYALLSKHSQYDLLQKLAQATKEINQLNIQHIDLELSKNNLYIKTKAEIQIKLIVSLLEYFELTSLVNDIKEAALYFLFESEKAHLMQDLYRNQTEFKKAENIEDSHPSRKKTNDEITPDLLNLKQQIIESLKLFYKI